MSVVRLTQIETAITLLANVIFGTTAIATGYSDCGCLPLNVCYIAFSLTGIRTLVKTEAKLITISLKLPLETEEGSIG